MNKNKILFIALHYPPSEGIADIRATNIARELSLSDYRITVLTANKSYYKTTSKHIPKEIENIPTIRVSFPIRLGGGNLKTNKFIPNVLKRIILKLLPIFGLDYLSFWQKNAIKEVIKRNEKYDYIIATGPPFSNFLLAKKLAKKLDAKYILDYRDLWNFSPHNETKKISIKKEKRILENAYLTICISNSMENLLQNKFEIKKSIVMTNGFNSEVFKPIKKKKFNKFTMSYVGRFYPPKRVIDPIFKAFKYIKENNTSIFVKLSFVYCGHSGSYIEAKAKEYNIAEIIINKNLVTREESFSVTKSSDLSIVITSVKTEANLSDKSILTGKVFEAIGMNTHILCIAPNNTDIRNLISQQDKGSAFTGEQIEDIAQFIIHKEKNRHQIKEKSKFEWSNVIKKIKAELV
jgi:glycosyltransferase involved in cell wall biosynthesis